MANKIKEIAYKEELLLLNHLGWMCFKSSSQLKLFYSSSCGVLTKLQNCNVPARDLF